MNKKVILTYTSILLGIVMICIFIFKSFEIIYFNEKYYRVPDFKGLTYEKVEEILNSTDLTAKKVGEEYSSLPIGEIFLQEPEAGSIVKRGRNIKVWTSLGNALVSVPNLNGLNYLDAKVIAEQKGLIIDKVVTIKGTGKYNEVLATDPSTGTLLTRGEKIAFLVNGAEEVVEIKMPDIIGLPFDSALEIVTKNNLIVGNVDFTSIPGVEKNVIIKTSVKAGEKLPAGSAVDLTINN